MKTSQEVACEKNCDYFQRQKLPWLRTFLHERGIQTSCDGKAKRKAELAELAFNAHKMKLPKVSDGESENTNTVIAELLRTDEGVLATPALINNWSKNLSVFPEVTFPDICNYLLGKADEYSAENLKSFKSLTGYRLFIDGHVMDLKIHKVPDKSYALVKFNVQPTERSKTGEGKDSYDGFVVLKVDGSIRGAFCPCQGGADGTCRHVAAALFDIERTVHNNSQQSSTSKECTWKRKAKPNEKSCSLEELKITKAEYGKASKQAIKPTTFDPTSLELDHLSFMDSLRAGLEEHVPSAVLLQLLPQTTAAAVTEAELTKLISHDNCVEHEEETVAVEVNTIAQLRDTFLASKEIGDSETLDVTNELCSEFLDFIKIDKDQAVMIFEKTKSQGNCDFWMDQRYGQITGSNFYRICHLRESTNKDNTLKDLLGYCPVPIEKQPAQFEWGHEKEKSAVDLYYKKMKKVHKELCVSECGLIVDPELPHLGSSPDRMRFCLCCGKRVVEVKSLFAKRSMLPHIAAADYIYKEDGIYKLKRETKWNYQIQGEMALSRVKHADLVIYTNKGIMVIDVPFDVKLWDDILVKLNKFYFKFMIPELLTQRIKKLC